MVRDDALADAGVLRDARQRCARIAGGGDRLDGRLEDLRAQRAFDE
jgi:hypothetical protein